jgi:MoxR-like ATPase
MAADLRTYTLYKKEEPRLVDTWPTLARAQPIPPGSASARPHKRPASVGVGLVRALCLLLTRGAVAELAYDPNARRWSLTTESTTAPGSLHHLGGTDATWWVEHAGYLTGLAMATDALTLGEQSAAAREFVGAWDTLLGELEAAVGHEAPYRQDELRRAAGLGGCTPAMMHATDSLYFYGTERAALSLDETVEQPAPVRQPAMGGAIERWIYRRVPPIATTGAGAPPRTGPVAPAPTANSTLHKLRRLLRRGGTALLVGPTGVGKSKCARLAGLEEGMRIVLMQGYPGLTYRELFGKVAPVVGPSGQEFRWIDGPLSEAWRVAQAGERVELIVDELARFDPYNLAPFLGALDKVAGREVLQMAGVEPDARRDLQAAVPDAEYRILKLPNGERLVAPASRLAIVATTNLGSDYVQVQQKFDAALLRRFEVQLDVERLGEGERLGILSDYHGIPAAVARVLVAVEDYTVTATGIHGGLLERELNLGTCINWATEARSLAEEGMGWGDAVLEAARDTAIPFVCPRDSGGRQAAAPAKSMEDIIERAVRQAHLPAA